MQQTKPNPVLDSAGLRGAQIRGDQKVLSVLGIRSSPTGVPSQLDRFAEAIAAVERALAEGDDAKTRDAIMFAGETAWNLAPQLVFALSMTAKPR